MTDTSTSSTAEDIDAIAGVLRDAGTPMPVHEIARAIAPHPGGDGRTRAVRQWHERQLALAWAVLDAEDMGLIRLAADADGEHPTLWEITPGGDNEVVNIRHSFILDPALDHTEVRLACWLAAQDSDDIDPAQAAAALGRSPAWVTRTVELMRGHGLVDDDGRFVRDRVVASPGQSTPEPAGPPP